VVKEAQDFVSVFLEEELPDNIVFHDFEHAKYVVDKAVHIGRECGLTREEMNVLIVSAWFHDTGYAVDPANHENESVKLATGFLGERGIDKAQVDQVGRAIMATQIPQKPKNLVSEVLCDADLYHLSEEGYLENIELLRLEMKGTSGKKLGKKKFHSLSDKFFREHQYRTDFAREVLGPKKERNLQLIQKEIIMLDKIKEEKALDKKNKKNKSYSRGVESMFRLTARNQINLSSIADNKSNILISVNAIMMSITMTVLVTRFDEVPNIILPTLVFLLFSLVTIVFAILSTRPNISSGKFTRADIEQNKVNLLFFGNFYNMELEEYEWAIGELMKNDEDLYSTMIKDQYSLGKVLARKYKLLRIAYNVFMFGIIISVVAFVLAFVNI
jgi:predicted metal-dependent HD superfamily phosphohydrolase